MSDEEVEYSAEYIPPEDLPFRDIIVFWVKYGPHTDLGGQDRERVVGVPDVYSRGARVVPVVYQYAARRRHDSREPQSTAGTRAKDDLAVGSLTYECPRRHPWPHRPRTHRP